MAVAMLGFVWLSVREGPREGKRGGWGKGGGVYLMDVAHQGGVAA